MATGGTKQGYLLALLAAAFIVICLLAYFLFEINTADAIWSNIVAGVVTSLFLFSAGYLLFTSRGIKLPSMQADTSSGAVISFYPTHEEVPWAEVIRNARTLDIVVHYYGRWVRKHHDEFVSFFQRGGQVRVVMADPEKRGILSAVHTHFFSNLTPAQLKSKIGETERALRQAFDEAASKKATLRVYYFPQVLHYSFVLSNSRTLYLSVYEQFRGPNIRSSVFGIDLSRDSELEEYWLENRKQFIDTAREAKPLA